ncbi:hypothetical protein [Amycolatopsis japonica]
MTDLPKFALYSRCQRNQCQAVALHLLIGMNKPKDGHRTIFRRCQTCECQWPERMAL